MGTPATLGSVKLVRTNCLRATFAVAPKAFDSEGAHDARNPANWTLTRLGSSGFCPAIQRIDAVTDPPSLAVDLWLRGEMQPGVAYELLALTAIEVA